MVENSPIEWALLPLKKYATFSGRAPRAEYWWFYLFSTVISGIADLIDGDTDYVSSIISLAFFLPSLAVMVRRLHDINRTGWWLASFLLPLLLVGAVAGIYAVSGQEFETGELGSWGAPMVVALIIFAVIMIILFIFMVTAGTEGENQYGPDPYRPDGNLEEVFS